MAQTPWRDIIKTAVVDFRFYNGTLKNYANTAWALAFTDGDPIFTKAHGVTALVYNADGVASQTWMTSIASPGEITIEFLAFLDMKHLADGVSADQTTNIITGDWNIGFANVPAAGQTFKTQLWASFNNNDYGDDYTILQNLNDTASDISSFRGSPIHVIMSAKFIAATSLEITTYVNGVYTNATSVDHTNHFIDVTPTNTLFDGATSGYSASVACPVYFFRMWNAYMEDTLEFADMFAQAKKILPGVTFPVPSSSALVFNAPA
jgi:hypothetical protein